MTTRLFIEPLDVLFLRGNKLFGDPGSYGESLVPPWPSAASGAIRSALLVDRDRDLAGYGRGEVTDDAELGTPRSPGTFTLAGFYLARRLDGGRVESLHPLPADLAASEGKDGTLEVRRIVPSSPRQGLACSSATPCLAVLPEPRRGKPQSGFWLTRAQWTAYLRGEAIAASDLVHTRDLWRIDERVGVGLDPARRRAADEQLFTVQAVALRKTEHEAAGGCQESGRHEKQSCTVGFLAEVGGAALPTELMLRLGGDGRGARATMVAADTAANAPSIDHEAIARAGRCRLILTSPGLFTGGWKPTGVTDGDGRGLRFDLGGVRGRLVCAAVPRAEVISGFDIANRRPKPAQRVAPTGSVYWLDELDATPDALRKLAGRGLWSDPAENEARRAEGFNRFTFAAH